MLFAKFSRFIFLLVISAILAPAAYAALLNNQPDLPIISFNDTATTATTYNATTDVFRVEAAPVQIFQSGQAPTFITPFPEGGEAVSIQIEVDSNGALAGTPTSQDLVVFGVARLASGLYIGDLLTGKVTEFGYFNSSGDIDTYDFKFTVTGGRLAFLYPAELVVVLTSENSTFTGDFNVDITGAAKGSIGGFTPGLASLGDFVWHDANANGVQDNGEQGIEGVQVNLLQADANGSCDNSSVFRTTPTGSNGEYNFTDLPPGKYCVEFNAPAGFALSPKDNSLDDSKDSDADPITGRTMTIILDAGENDTSWDAGVYQTASLGDYVWFDINQDGYQDSNESGVDGVVVNLLDCSGAAILDQLGQPITTTTNVTGNYIFDNLIPGDYMVEFVQLAGYSFSPQDPMFGDALDSDANIATGRSGCITLASGENNINIDAGIYNAATCDVSVTKSCEVVTPVVNTTNFSCSDAKPLDQLSMIWNGSENIDVVAHYGKLDGAAITTVNGVSPGDEVTISGFAGAGNDVEWELFKAGTTISLGKSGFHMSCSDAEMSGPEHCGTPQGNNKNNDGGLNSWLFEGMAGNGAALDCTPVQQPVASTVNACSFTTPAWPHCEGKVVTMDLQYVAGDCSIAPNLQEGKAKCIESGVIDENQPVRIRVTDGGSKTYLDTNLADVMKGDVVTASAANAGTNEFGSGTFVEVFDVNNALVQKVELHTSCSKPLDLGDRFGSVKLVTLNTTDNGNQSLGAQVNFNYVITNNSAENYVGSAVDDSLGAVEDPLTLAQGEIFEVNISQFVLPDATDVFASSIVVTGALSPSGMACQAEAATTVTRTIELPDCSVRGENKLHHLHDDKIEWNIFNTGNDPVTVESVMVTFPGDRGIKKIKLDGDIFTNGNVTSPALVDTFVNDLKNRQIKVGDDKKLEIEFTGKTQETIPSDYSITVNFVGGCSVTLDPEAPVFGTSDYQCSKPIDELTMIWTGVDNVSVEAFKGDTNTVSLGVKTVSTDGEISFSGFAGSPNDVYWVMHNSDTGEYIGESKFHMSCSDSSMNGPEDCGAQLGNGKDDNTSFLNSWKLEGIVDANGTLNCTP